MLCLGKFRISIERPRRSPAMPRPTRRRGGRLAVPGGVAIAAAMLALPVALASPVQAAGSGGTSLTLNVVPSALSITVSQSSETFGNCSGGLAPTPSTSDALGFPNAECFVGQADPLDDGGVVPITITNTGVASDVDVNGANAGNENGNWALCNVGGTESAQTCSGEADTAGPDQFELQTFTDTTGSELQVSPNLGLVPQCDEAFDFTGSESSAGCTATPGQVQNEGVEIFGPQSTGDPDSSYTTSVVWTAVAQ
jgi:hypothetical protein